MSSCTWVYFNAVCRDCGKQFMDHQPEFLLKQWEEKGKPFPSQCQDCFQAWRRAEEERDAQALYEEELSESELDAAVEKAGVEEAYRLKKAPVPFVAEWLWNNRDANLLLSGTTGTGKSTSAGVVVREIIRHEHATVNMCYMYSLLDHWRALRCDNNDPTAIKEMFRRLETADYLIIDEVAGKVVNTDSSREFMFRLLEDITNGACRARVFLLGNFYRGSVADIFGDADPAFRRLKERFRCGRIDVVKKQIVPIHFNFSK